MNIGSTCYNKLRGILNDYNWDDGFALPKKILRHPLCDLALAMEIFYLGDGYGYFGVLMNKGEGNMDWLKFISQLYDDIVAGKYPKTKNTYHIPLTKTQAYRLKKANIADVFLAF